MIDALTVGVDSPFLQQAAQITGGMYLKRSAPDQSFLQLLFVCAADRATRTSLTPPAQPDVDFRASCFCHQRPVDIAFVCSVCLSIFCSFAPVCPTCKYVCLCVCVCAQSEGFVECMKSYRCACLRTEQSLPFGRRHPKNKGVCMCTREGVGVSFDYLSWKKARRKQMCGCSARSRTHTHTQHTHKDTQKPVYLAGAESKGFKKSSHCCCVQLLLTSAASSPFTSTVGETCTEFWRP